MKFEMLLSDNFASFKDEGTGDYIFVDSFDNKEFEVRVGSLQDSKSLGKITASTNDELNEKLSELYSKNN